MSASYFAITLWEDDEEFLVQVTGQTTYRVSGNRDEAHISAPGLEKTVELEDGVHPSAVDEAERLAIVLVAMLEGGVEL